MRCLFALSLFIAGPAFAQSRCDQVFMANARAARAQEASLEAERLKSKQVADLEARLERFLGTRGAAELTVGEAWAARSLLGKLRRGRPSIDLDLFSVYLSIRERTISSKAGEILYEDPYAGIRPGGLRFQFQHWSWLRLHEYFFDAPSSMIETKKEDLAYLEFVAGVARRTALRSDLHDVLVEANKEWDLQRLRDPAVRDDFLRFISKGKSQDLWSRFEGEFEAWSSTAAARGKERLVSETREALNLLRGGTSLLDLYVLEKFFDLASSRNLNDALTYSDGRQGYVNGQKPFHDPRGYPGDGQPYAAWVAMTDFRVFEMGLSSGSVSYLVDFLAQNGHDTAMKGHCLNVLSRMSRQRKNSMSGRSFFWGFQEAHQSLISDPARLLPAPETIQADFRLFSVTPATPGRSQRFLQQTLVAWSPVLGQLHASVVDFYPLDRNANATLAASPNMKHWVQQYFDRFRQEQTYENSEIQHDQGAELGALLADSTYLVFTKPGEDTLLSMIRIFDASHSPTYIEAEFPAVHFPERAAGGRIFELGRLLSTPEVQGNSLSTVLARVADYFVNTGGSGMIYMDGNQAAKTYYTRIGSEVVFNPEDLNLAPSATPVWVLRMPVAQMIQQFSTAEFETIRLRAK